MAQKRREVTSGDIVLRLVKFLFVVFPRNPFTGYHSFSFRIRQQKRVCIKKIYLYNVLQVSTNNDNYT
jgi:hypothetical protein